MYITYTYVHSVWSGATCGRIFFLSKFNPGTSTSEAHMYHDAAALCPARIEARTAEQQLWKQRLSDVTRESVGGMEEHEVSAARTPFQPTAGCCQSVPCRLLTAYGSVRQCGRVRQRGGFMGVVVAAADVGSKETSNLGPSPQILLWRP